MMTAVFRHYLDTSILPRRVNPNKKTRMEMDIRRYFRRVIEHMSTRSQSKEGFSAAEFDLLRQRELAVTLAGEGQSPKSISTTFAMVNAALNYSAKDRIVATDSGERIVRLLRYTPTIMTSETAIAELVGADVSHPRWFIPTVAQCASVIDGIQHDHVFRFFIVALTTWARPTAVLQFSLDQVDFRFGVVDLLPAGKRQTKKRRPVIPLAPTLRAWLEHWGSPRPIVWGGAPIAEINDAFRRIVRPLGMPEFTPYTLRHFVSSEAIARGASDADRSRMLGHLPKSAAATSSWYEHGIVAGYLKSAIAATESLLDDLQGLCGRPLRAPTTLPQRHLRAV